MNFCNTKTKAIIVASVLIEMLAARIEVAVLKTENQNERPSN